MILVRDGADEKPPIGSANLSEEIPADDPFWTVAAFAAKREVEAIVRLRVKRDPNLLRWWSGEGDAAESGINAINASRWEHERETSRASLRVYLEQEKTLGDAARWPSPIIEERPSAAVRPRGRATSADRSANYIGVVGSQIFRLAETQEAELRAAFREPLPIFLPERPIYDDDPADFETYRGQTVERGELARRYGVASNSLVALLLAIIECEESGERCDPLERSVAAVSHILQARATDPTTPRHVVDAYAVATWRFLHGDDSGRRVQVDDGRTVLTLQIGRKSRYLRLLVIAAAMIAAQYRSSVEAAVLFLISRDGLGHRIAQIDYQTDGEPTALARIVLTVDPTLSPDEVRSLYRHARGRLIDYHQDVSDVSMELAGFVYSQKRVRTTPTVDESLSGDWTEYDQGWRSLMEDWNADQATNPTPGRRGKAKIYREMHKFRSDAEAARDRLLNRKLKGHPESLEHPPLEVFEASSAAPKAVIAPESE